jgi:hypothetical protein
MPAILTNNFPNHIKNCRFCPLLRPGADAAPIAERRHPAKIKKWTDVENVKLLYEFFKMRMDQFE